MGSMPKFITHFWIGERLARFNRKPVGSGREEIAYCWERDGSDARPLNPRRSRFVFV
ncbi:hypothetical protein ABIF97_000503 [Bradyrhizobium japonicum]